MTYLVEYYQQKENIDTILKYIILENEKQKNLLKTKRTYDNKSLIK